MLTFVVQAGGDSRRMGVNKALLPFMGQPLISRVIERLKPYSQDILITANDNDPLDFLGFPVVGDIILGAGALGGLYTALSAASRPFVAVVACDMPFVNGDLLFYQYQLLMSSDSDAVIPHSGDGLEPLHAVYRQETCLPAVRDALAAGQRRMISWLPQVRVKRVDVEDIRRHDPTGLAFMNVNTPEEFEQAERLAQRESG